MAEIQITTESITLDNPDKIVKLIKFAGQLDESNVDEKSTIVYELIDSLPNGASIILDFNDLEYMNSKSIGYLSDWFSRISTKGGKLIIAQVRENISDILNVVGLSKIIPVTMTLDEAKLEIMRN